VRFFMRKLFWRIFNWERTFIIKGEVKMYEKRSKNAYGKFETASLSDTGGSIARVKGDAERSITASHVALKPQVNKWIVFALAASSSFITTLDGSIVNIGLPAISQTFHVGVSGCRSSHFWKIG